MNNRKQSKRYRIASKRTVAMERGSITFFVLNTPSAYTSTARIFTQNEKLKAVFDGFKNTHREASLQKPRFSNNGESK